MSFIFFVKYVILLYCFPSCLAETCHFVLFPLCLAESTPADVSASIPVLLPQVLFCLLWPEGLKPQRPFLWPCHFFTAPWLTLHLCFICRPAAVLFIGKPPCSGLQGERGQDLCQHSRSSPCGESK